MPEPEYSYAGLTALLAAVIDQAAVEYALACEARTVGWKAADFLEHCGTDTNECRKALHRIRRNAHHRRRIIKAWQERAKMRAHHEAICGEVLAST